VMRRLGRLGLIPFTVLLLMVVAVQVAASKAERTRTPVDLDMLITMPGGGSRPLREVLAPVEPPSAAAEREDVPPAERHGPRLREEGPAERVSQWSFDAQVAGDAEPVTLCALAEQRFYAGDFAQARALYASVAPDDPEYGRAQRRLGWEIQTRLEGNPLAGVGSVNRSLRADPLDGNAWQDASRVYVEGLLSLFR